MADKGYRGDHRIRTPLDALDEFHQTAMAKCRARHETINRRFKIFGALSQKFRHHWSKHIFVFQAVLALTEIEIENGAPAFDVTEYSDPIDLERGSWVVKNEGLDGDSAEHLLNFLLLES